MSTENNYFVQQESGFNEGNLHEMDKFNLIRPESGEPVDPRLFTILGFFKEIYFEKREFFKKIFPRLYDEFAELMFNKIGGVLSQREGAKARTVQRSLSFGSNHEAKQGEESTIWLKRFKIRTPDFSGVQQGGQDDDQKKQGGQENTKPIGSI